MEPMYYIGLDVRKRKISYCVKDRGGKLYAEGSLSATRLNLDRWMKTLPQPWTAALEATMFTGWIYDHLKPHAAALKVAHPLCSVRSPPRKGKTTASMPARFAIACAAISCRSVSVTWPRRPFASGDARCAIATCWCDRWCR
jgi:hypothetical protein